MICGFSGQSIRTRDRRPLQTVQRHCTTWWLTPGTRWECTPLLDDREWCACILPLLKIMIYVFNIFMSSLPENKVKMHRLKNLNFLTISMLPRKSTIAIMFYEPFIEFPLKSLYGIIALIGKKKWKMKYGTKKSGYGKEHSFLLTFSRIST